MGCQRNPAEQAGKKSGCRETRLGEIIGVFVEGQDVTEVVQAQAKQQLLLDELNHRVKNTSASVQAIVTQTLRTAAPTTHGFGGRLIEPTLVGELNGSARLDYRVEGLRCTLKAPMKGPAG